MNWLPGGMLHCARQQMQMQIATDGGGGSTFDEWDGLEERVVVNPSLDVLERRFERGEGGGVPFEGGTDVVIVGLNHPEEIFAADLLGMIIDAPGARIEEEEVGGEDRQSTGFRFVAKSGFANSDPKAILARRIGNDCAIGQKLCHVIPPVHWIDSFAE